MRRTGQDEPFRVRQPGQQQPVCLSKAGPEGVALATEYGQGRLADAPRFRLAKAPAQLPGQLALEPGPRVVHRLSEGPRPHPVEDSAVPRPRPPRLQELIHDGRRARFPVALFAPRQRLPIALGTRSHHQRRLQQSQRVDHARGVQRQLEGDVAAVRVPHDMRPFHAQVAQQSPAVGGLLSDADWPGGAAAVHIAAAMVEDEPVPAR